MRVALGWLILALTSAAAAYVAHQHGSPAWWCAVWSCGWCCACLYGELFRPRLRGGVR